MPTDAELEYLRSEIDHRGIYRVPPGGRRLPGKAPNSWYTWQFYLRRCLFDPTFAFLAGENLLARMPEGECQFAAVEDAGVPLAQAMATITCTPFISVKKQRKGYGLLNWTEGRVTGAPLVLVDDLAGSQASLKAARKILVAYQLNVAPVYVTIVDKTQGTHPEAYLQGSKLISLFTCEDFAMTWEAYRARYDRFPEFGPTY